VCPNCSAPIPANRLAVNHCPKCAYRFSDASMPDAGPDLVAVSQDASALAPIRLITSDTSFVAHSETLFYLIRLFARTSRQIWGHKVAACDFSSAALAERSAAVQRLAVYRAGLAYDAKGIGRYFSGFFEHLCHLETVGAIRERIALLLQAAQLQPEAKNMIAFGGTDAPSSKAFVHFAGRPPRCFTVQGVARTM